MPTGKYKSHHFRRVFKRTPGARKVLHYVERVVKVPKCGVCKTTLKGLPRLTGSEFRNLSKSQKRVERPFGGNLCSKCARSKIKQYARSLAK
ncbi:MAG: 50S ribosomal protein L34e [Candidatus Woesearchaeota archaeon]|jgi:large subunit ribosomal protein L34e